MLTYLHVKNFTILKELSLDFSDGMTVLTGETGAGKSIIIDTLELALGGRADASIIYPEAEKCEVTVTFDICKYKDAIKWLKDHELYAVDNAEECIIRRIINKEGRSKYIINDSPCTQQLVREFGSLLVNIHGQHEHQNLLKADQQLILLDAFAENFALNNRVKNIYMQWLQTKKQLEALQNLTENRSAKLDFLNHQITELENLALVNNEVENLHQEHLALNNATTNIANCSAAIEIAADNDDASVLSYINTARDYLENIKNKSDKINSIIELFNNAYIQVDEACAELRRHIDSIENNQEKLATIDQRLNNIYDVARKHKVKPEELPQILCALKTEWEELDSAELAAQKLTDELNGLERTYHEVAEMLSKKRQAAAGKLNKLITEKIKTLGMEGGEFKIKFETNADQLPKAHGLERAEFWVQTNPGQQFWPLNKIASGGELSRISLAIQVITAEKNNTPVLIFDEVDAGIGGKTAEIVGKLLRKLGDNAQVLCITHLPQVASHASHHFKVSKQTMKGAVEVSIAQLDKKERVAEIARMLGGENITERTLAHAKEMLD